MEQTSTNRSPPVVETSFTVTPREMMRNTLSQFSPWVLAWMALVMFGLVGAGIMGGDLLMTLGPPATAVLTLGLIWRKVSRIPEARRKMSLRVDESGLSLRDGTGSSTTLAWSAIKEFQRTPRLLAFTTVEGGRLGLPLYAMTENRIEALAAWTTFHAIPSGSAATRSARVWILWFLVIVIFVVFYNVFAPVPLEGLPTQETP